MTTSVGAITIERTGGPEVLSWGRRDLPPPGPGQVRVRHTAVGVNYIDTYHRSGLYPVPLPSGLGLEAAGIVEETGPEVTALKAGDRVAYGTGPIGAYSEAANCPADRVVPVPDGITDDMAAAIMLKGMTVQYLLRRTYPVKAGDTILVHAAAGGVGLLACQWAHHLGATVIGTVGTDEKAALAAQNGCHHPIVYTRDNVVERVKELTGGAGVPVVYDGVGKDTWDMSLDCLKPRGLMVSFGNASGAVPSISVGDLSAKGSLFLTRPTLFHYTMTPEDLKETADDLFAVILAGAVKVSILQTYSLAEARTAHEDLEARKTTGATLLRP
ncbi:MAG: quinone oxidoreductase [Alphaproteobacteria bacterium]